MAEKANQLVQRLISILGPENVLAEEEKIVARPSSTAEAAGVISIALEENIPVEASKYFIGPAGAPIHGKKIVLSLDRMNKTSFHRDRLCLQAEPAAEIGEIVKIALGSGLNFPGKTCLHNGLTIGENVAACFVEGEPYFKCHVACLCGLEMVLFDGRVLTLGESTAKDLDNYQLSYILSGYSQDRAVITGVNLKLSSSASDLFWLASLNKDLGDLLEVLPSIIQTYSHHLQSIVAVKSNYRESSAALIEMLPSAGEAGAFVLFTFHGSFAALEPVLNGIAGYCSRSGPSEVFVAGESYRKLTLPSIFNSLLKNLESDPHLIDINTYKFEFPAKEKSENLTALTWEKDNGMLKLFYGK